MADLKGESIYAKLYFEQGKRQWETLEMPKTAYGERDTGIEQNSEWFSRLYVSSTLVQFVQSQVAHKKTCEMFAKSSVKSDEALLLRSLLG